MSEKRYFAVKRTFVDTVNGIHGSLHDIVFTNCEKWVARMGSALESSSPPEAGTVVIDVANTKEDAEVVEVAASLAPDAQSKRKALARDKANKMIDAEEKSTEAE
jgi:hypothetical protein